jgi:hypothetical protein
MAVVTTFTAHIRDWKALQSLHRETLIDWARKLGATRYRVFRNASDAAEVLVMVELTSYEDAQEMVQVVGTQLLPILVRDVRPADIWEPIGWEEID